MKLCLWFKGDRILMSFIGGRIEVTETVFHSNKIIYLYNLLHMKIF